MSQSPSLPPIELHVLEVEPLPAPTVPPPQGKQPGDALKRWRDVGVRVMTQIALGQDPFEGKSKSADSNSPVPEKKSEVSKPRSSESDSKMPSTRMPPINKGKKQGKPQKVAWGNNGTPRTPSSPSRQYRNPGRAPTKKKSVVEPAQKASQGGGMKFASLVRLARFRKMSVRKMDDDTKKEEQEEEEEEVVPVKPRFCTSMSAEAQYAMLKGYEDMLLNTLQTKVRSDRREALYRVRTPHKPVQSLYLAEQQLEDENTTQKIIPLSNDNTEHFSRHTNVPKIPTLPREPSMPRTASLSGNFHDNKDANKDKQLRLTSRFERAHDILDSVRLSQGSLVTSPRALHKAPGKKQKNPLDHYNAWSHAWSKEFKLLYGTSQQHVTIE